MTLRLNSKLARQLGVRVREARERQGLTLVALGKACDVHHSQLSRIERGEIAFLSKNIEIICTFLQIETSANGLHADQPLLARVKRLIEASGINARAIESLVMALEEYSEGQS